jgi:ribosome-associated protein
LDVRALFPFADYFVLCSGTSERMVDALAKAVLDKTRELHKLHGRVEGHAQDGWMLVDFGDVIVHVFSIDQREYYNLEEVWREAHTLLHVQ